MPNHCIYCGILLKGNPVRNLFPMWLRKRFDIDGSVIRSVHGGSKHRNLKVPCCRRCSSLSASELDNLLMNSLPQRPLSVARKQSTLVLIWACKILVGLSYLD